MAHRSSLMKTTSPNWPMLRSRVYSAQRTSCRHERLMFAAVDKGNTALAIDLDHHKIDPVFTDMQQRVNTEAIRYRAEAIQRLAELAATEQFVFDSTLIVFPIGLILLAGLLFVIRAYQRSEMAHAVAHARI